MNVHRYRRVKMSPARLKLRESADRAWDRCEALALGLASQLEAAYDAEGLLRVLRIVPELEMATRRVEAAWKSFETRPKRKRTT